MHLRPELGDVYDESGCLCNSNALHELLWPWSVEEIRNSMDSEYPPEWRD